MYLHLIFAKKQRRTFFDPPGRRLKKHHSDARPEEQNMHRRKKNYDACPGRISRLKFDYLLSMLHYQRDSVKTERVPTSAIDATTFLSNNVYRWF